MDSVELRTAILDVAFMRHFSEDLRGKVAVLFQEVAALRRVPKNAAWIRQNEPAENKGYLLVEGAVAIQKPDAPEISCEAPELLGEMMQFNPTHLRTATVVAMRDCVVLQFLWDDFWARTRQRLSEPEQEKVRQVLEEVAWEHLTG